MTSNTGKRLDKLHKEITELGAKGGKFHFVVGDTGESSGAMLERLKAKGVIQPGDQVQLVDVPWKINELKGGTYIPEGSGEDPYAEPPLPPDPIVTDYAAQREREERWKKHERQIERDGQRFDPNKRKDTGWR
jgi:hypothetical protein